MSLMMDAVAAFDDAPSTLGDIGAQILGALSKTSSPVTFHPWGTDNGLLADVSDRIDRISVANGREPPNLAAKKLEKSARRSSFDLASTARRVSTAVLHAPVCMLRMGSPAYSRSMLTTTRRSSARPPFRKGSKASPLHLLLARDEDGRGGAVSAGAPRAAAAPHTPALGGVTVHGVDPKKRGRKLKVKF